MNKERFVCAIEGIDVKNHHSVILQFLFTTYATVMLILFAETARNYPPPGYTAPEGVEGVNTIGLFLFIVLLGGGVAVIKEQEHFLRQKFTFPLGAIGVSLLYIFGSTVAVYKGNLTFPYSYPSLSIVIIQAILLGTIFEIANRPDPEGLETKSVSEVEFHLENWRQFTRIFLSLSLAVGIGFFLQTYSNNHLNSEHLAFVFGPLAFGLCVCLELLRRQITHIGTFLNK